MFPSQKEVNFTTVSLFGCYRTVLNCEASISTFSESCFYFDILWNIFTFKELRRSVWDCTSKMKWARPAQMSSCFKMCCMLWGELRLALPNCSLRSSSQKSRKMKFLKQFLRVCDDVVELMRRLLSLEWQVRLTCSCTWPGTGQCQFWMEIDAVTQLSPPKLHFTYFWSILSRVKSILKRAVLSTAVNKTHTLASNIAKLSLRPQKWMKRISNFCFECENVWVWKMFISALETGIWKVEKRSFLVRKINAGIYTIKFVP